MDYFIDVPKEGVRLSSDLLFESGKRAAESIGGGCCGLKFSDEDECEKSSISSGLSGKQGAVPHSKDLLATVVEYNYVASRLVVVMERLCISRNESLSWWDIYISRKRVGENPIQVFNEYRNALDHFVRFYSFGSRADIGRMSGHLLRAGLDASKMICRICMLDIAREIDKYGVQFLSVIYNSEEVLGVRGGRGKVSFYSAVNTMRQQGIEKFESAKRKDFELGRGGAGDLEVLKEYVLAVESFYTALLLFEVNRDVLNKGRWRWGWKTRRLGWPQIFVVSAVTTLVVWAWNFVIRGS